MISSLMRSGVFQLDRALSGPTWQETSGAG